MPGLLITVWSCRNDHKSNERAHGQGSAMNLCERLQTRTPTGYGQRFQFEYRGNYGWDKSSVIFLVVERYAERFGAITESQANVLYKRLANKYCTGIGVMVCYKSIEFCKDKENSPGIYYAHPKTARDASNALRRTFLFKGMWEQAIKTKVQYATKNADGAYARLDFFGGECRLCGGHTRYSLWHPGITGQQGNFDFVFIFQNPPLGGICRRPMCKALVKKFSAICNGYSKFPMAKILMELTKNGNRSKTIAEIEEVFKRDVHTIHKRGIGKRRSKDSRAISD